MPEHLCAACGAAFTGDAGTERPVCPTCLRRGLAGGRPAQPTPSTTGMRSGHPPQRSGTPAGDGDAGDSIAMKNCGIPGCILVFVLGVVGLVALGILLFFVCAQADRPRETKPSAVGGLDGRAASVCLVAH